MPEVTIRPICGRVLLQVIPMSRKAGNLVLPDNVDRSKYREAWVKALPNGYRGDLNVGDRVMVPPYPEREVVINKETLVFAKATEIQMALVS